MYLVCGEALFDVFLKGDDPAGGLELEARPGGSPFNVSIGIARLGGRAALLTGISNDMLGERLFSILSKESVSTNYLVRSGNRTTLSMVGLDEIGQPSYVFYGLGSADCSLNSEDIPAISADVTAFHFGSYSLVVRPVADAFLGLLESTGNAFVSVDPNVRPTVEPSIDIWRHRVDDYAARANLLKISTEDLEILYPEMNPGAKADEWMSMGVDLVVITDGGRGVRAWTKSGHDVRVVPPSAEVIDTVGAGDSFQAALLAKLAEDGNGDPKLAIADLSEEHLTGLIHFAASAASITCRRRGADLPYRHEVLDCLEMA